MIAKSNSAALQESVLRYLRLRTRQSLEDVCVYARPYIDSAVSNFGNSEFDRDDMRSEAYIGVMRAAMLYREEASFATVVHRVARNAGLDYIRRKGRAQWMKYVGPEDPRLERSQEDSHDIGNSELLARLLELVPDENRKLLEMHYLFGLELKDISRRCKVNVATVNSRICRAKDRIRKLAVEYHLI